MPLTDVELRAGKPRAPLLDLSDGGGLQLWVYPDGARRWRMAYRCAGSQTTLAIGVSLNCPQRAPEARERSKRLLDSRDPSVEKKVAEVAKAGFARLRFESQTGLLRENAGDHPAALGRAASAAEGFGLRVPERPLYISPRGAASPASGARQSGSLIAPSPAASASLSSSSTSPEARATTTRAAMPPSVEAKHGAGHDANGSERGLRRLQIRRGRLANA
jgi:hypothetical protein